MSAVSPLMHTAVIAVCLSPTLLLVALAVPSLFRRPLSERSVGLVTRAALLVALTAATVALTTHLAGDRRPVLLSLGSWFAFERGGFSLDFLIDGLSLGFTALSVGICGITAAFSFRYLHLEPGFHRYFVQLALFVLGMTLVSLAGSIEVLFAGWELLGLSSALLVGFFHERPAPVRNALHVFAVYRISDAAMLSAAVLLHHWAGSGSLARLFSHIGGAAVTLDSHQTVVIAVLLLVAVAGKSALLPFSGWLPRAMEGPTSSSAVYYGALSIHAGAFLLLRAAPLLEQSPLAQILAGLAGGSTALYATITARAQCDVKSALAYASLTQVGLIVLEISLGFTTIALVHMVGHACFRMLQLLSAPNILHDLHQLDARAEDSVGEPAHPTGDHAPHPLLYFFALERGLIDPLLDRWVVHPFFAIAQRFDAVDRLLCGGRIEASNSRQPPDQREAR